MKVFALILLGTLSTIGCHALPLGNPADASLLCDGLILPQKRLGDFSLRLGFYGDYVFNRHLEVKIPGNPGIRTTEIYTNAGYIALNYRNRIDLFATIGASEIDLILDQPVFGPLGAQEQIFSQTDFSWSIGLRGTLIRYCGLVLGLEGQYFYFHPDLDTIVIAGALITFPFINQINIKYQEWQVGLGLSYPIAIAACGATTLVPYIGYKFSWAQYDFHNQEFVDGSITFDVEKTRLTNARDHGGYAVGVTLVGCNKASITAEARFVDEKALYINSQFRF